jgi:outer membrane protein
MKKILIASLGCGFVFGFSMLVNADSTTSVISIDSMKIMMESQEGKKISTQVQSDVTKFQNEVKAAQKQLDDMQTDLSKKAKVLSAEALQEKTEELAEKKKSIERDLAGKEESLRMKIQRKQLALRDKQMTIINEQAQKNNWPVVVDKNTPGVLFVSTATDRTGLVLQAIDERYNAEKTTKAVDGKINETATIKTATKDTKAVEKTVETKTTKVA